MLSGGPALLLDVCLDDREWGSSTRSGEIGRGPEPAAHGCPVDLAGEVLPEPTGGHAFQRVDHGRHGDLRRVLDQEVDVVLFPVELDEGGIEVAADCPHGLFAAGQHGVVEHFPTVLRREDQVHMHRRNHVPTTAVVVAGFHRPIRYTGCVIVRYAYRIYPTPDQQVMLAKTFGCARVVFNDALRVWQDAYEHGVKMSDSEVRTRVTSEAKHAPHRAWLAEVSHVALGESFRDAARARKNWFASLSGKRKGRKVGAPRFKSKRGRQAIRLARNGFSLHGDRLYVAKVGDIEVRWSRGLPSVPSSVTVTREPDGRYYASFVVERDAELLRVTEREVGVDLGLATFATLNDGRKVENPRRMRAREKALARAQRRLSRKVKGSNNRRKAAVKVAVLHRKVRNSRADYLHKAAVRLVRENQAIYVEDLAVSGLARTRLAKSVHDAGWGMFVRLLEEKAEYHGRRVVKVDRWFPSSQLCSACGFKDGPKPLDVREWVCPSCGVRHDRDVNAARNILLEGRRTAAGLAVDVCGADVSPGATRAVGVEAETLVA